MNLEELMQRMINMSPYNEVFIKNGFRKFSESQVYISKIDTSSINPNWVQERNKEDRGDGSATHYYELPQGATELRHIIRHKKMEHGIGEAFSALYRLNDNGERLRNLKKALFYIQCEIEFEEKR